MKKILVIGASGTVGSKVVARLAAQGHAVLATTSRRDAKGVVAAAQAGAQSPGHVETVYLDAAKGEGIAAAFEGVQRAFLMAPPGYADQEKLLAPLVAEAKRRGLEKVVLMTAMGANAADTPFRRVEQALERSGLAWNIVRPNWFMQNFHTFWVQGINEQGKILLPAGNAKVSFIDAGDIAEVLVRLLTRDDVANGDFDITGPAALDHDEVARILAAETGRDIRYQEIEPQALRAGLVAHGVPADYADFLLVILGFLKAGYAERTTTSVKELLGREPKRFEAYAREQRNAWKPVRAAA